MKNPNSRQVGGAHYGGSIFQHWDFAVLNRLGYLPGQVTKYICRWREKNGVQDLEKALHYLEKLIAVHGDETLPLPTGPRAALCPERLAKVYRLTPEEKELIVTLTNYHTLAELQGAARVLDGIITVQPSPVRRRPLRRP